MPWTFPPISKFSWNSRFHHKAVSSNRQSGRAGAEPGAAPPPLLHQLPDQWTSLLHLLGRSVFSQRKRLHVLWLRVIGGLLQYCGKALCGEIHAPTCL